jgi:thiamine pyrophosphokinase
MATDMSTFIILLGGNLAVNDRLLAHLPGARIIAADGGMRHAETLGVTPELWVGDFDSTPKVLLDQWPDVIRQSYPAAKALTDGEIAIEAALERGATSLILMGALGGERSDHAVAHMVMAVAMTLLGHSVMLTSGDEEVWPLIPGSLSLTLPKGALFSVLGFTELRELTISNARYSLSNFDLVFGSSRTISNVAEGTVHFSLTSGQAIVLARPYDFTGI